MLKTMSQRMARINKGGNLNEETVFIDPASIALYATIIVEVIKLVKKCREAKDVPNVAAQPTQFQQRVVKRVVRKHMGWKQYFNNGNGVVRSVFQVGAIATPEEIEELYKEV